MVVSQLSLEAFDVFIRDETRRKCIRHLHFDLLAFNVFVIQLIDWMIPNPLLIFQCRSNFLEFFIALLFEGFLMLQRILLVQRVLLVGFGLVISLIILHLARQTIVRIFHHTVGAFETLLILGALCVVGDVLRQGLDLRLKFTVHGSVLFRHFGFE